MRINVFEPIRVNPKLPLGVFTDEQLAAGVTRHIVCWSATRRSLDLSAKPSFRRSRSGDPFEVGPPEPLTYYEVRELERYVNSPNSDQGEAARGPVLCGYRIPVTLKAVAADGKTPFDLGPFQRRVVIETADGDAKSVTVSGRVKGFLDIGTGGNDETGDLKFAAFSAKFGKRLSLVLSSEEPGVELEFDRARTPEFLDAAVTREKTPAVGGQSWTLRVDVLPGKAAGRFPRPDDPVYEDSAVYLKAKLPGKGVRPVRIGVSGLAGG
jgi:hypothetical protein